MSEYRDSELKIAGNHWAVRVDTYGCGAVATPFGFVRVYAKFDFTSLEFILAGVQYCRTWRTGFTSELIAGLAYKFAKEKARS